MNVTEVPEQIVAAEGLLVMLMVGFAEEFTVIVMALLVTGDGVAQASDDVIRQVTVFPFASEELVNVGLLVPAFEPLTCH